MNIFVLFLTLQITIRCELVPDKDTFYLMEPVLMKVILKNEGESAWRIIPPYAPYEDFIKFFIYYHHPKRGKILMLPRERILPFIILPRKTKKCVENFANKILNPGDSAVYYYFLASRDPHYANSEFLFVAGEYEIESIRYGSSRWFNPEDKLWSQASPPVWVKKVLFYKMNKKIYVKRPTGKLKEIFDLWEKARKRCWDSGYRDYSLYPKVLEICPDTSFYLPNILLEYLGGMKQKRFWMKKFLNSYLYHPFVIKFLSDKKWLEENVLPYGKEFIDSLPDKVKNEIYKTLKRGW